MNENKDLLGFLFMLIHESQGHQKKAKQLFNSPILPLAQIRGGCNHRELVNPPSRTAQHIPTFSLRESGGGWNLWRCCVHEKGTRGEVVRV